MSGGCEAFKLGLKGQTLFVISDCGVERGNARQHGWAGRRLCRKSERRVYPVLRSYSLLHMMGTQAGCLFKGKIRSQETASNSKVLASHVQPHPHFLPMNANVRDMNIRIAIFSPCGLHHSYFCFIQYNDTQSSFEIRSVTQCSKA